MNATIKASVIAFSALLISCNHSKSSYETSVNQVRLMSICTLTENVTLQDKHEYISKGWIREGLPIFRTTECPKRIFTTLPSQAHPASRNEMQKAMNDTMSIVQGGVYGSFSLQVVFNKQMKDYDVRLIGYSDLRPMGLAEFLEKN